MTDASHSPSRFVRSILMATALLWASAGAAATRQSPQRLESDSSLAAFDAPAVLQPGDVLQIHVWRQAEYSGEFEITGDGMIGHPLYRQIRAGGRLVADVEEDLHILLTRYLGEPNFLVEGLFRVAVGGEVRSPDIYSLTAQTTITRAIAQAGGPTERARVDRVLLRRDGQPHMVDLTSPDGRLWDLEVRSGDAIVVERRVDVFREYVAPSAAVVAAIAAVLRLVI
ncbi:MAG: polysaccharide biosynthesis/export family protein [Longimicrobiales bacterium]